MADILFPMQKWDGEFFVKTSLRDEGITYQLGHDCSTSCPNPVPGSRKFVVVDVSGYHHVAVNFCGCQEGKAAGAGDHHVQLLRARWFPATTTKPKTVFTFTVLDHFHQLTLQAKTNLYDFSKTLQRKTDNTSPYKKIVSS